LQLVEAPRKSAALSLICALPITALVARAEHFAMLKVVADTTQRRVSYPNTEEGSAVPDA
jgi:hypothetical protein